MFYIDKDYKCHTSDPNEEYRVIELDLFKGKCETFIEGHRYLPPGESWTREDGVVFHGEMISPWKDYDELDDVQREYEKQKLAESTEALIVLGVNA
jgi:hypothetical protein